MMKFPEARQRALDAGASEADVDRYRASFDRRGRGVPERNMIRALQMHSWHNSADDWARLAGALAPKRKEA